MKELVTEIARAMVDKPDQVRVDMIEGRQSAMLELRVAKSDTAIVIGKGGRTAKAIRDILYNVCSKNNKRVTLDIIE